MKLIAIASSGLLVTAFLWSQEHADVQPHKPYSGTSSIVHVNEQAKLLHAGNSAAATELTHQFFQNAAIPTDVADALGFTKRVVTAESSYRGGSHKATHEADIVKAVNNLANTIGAPSWARTNQVEVRKLRMRLMVAYPQLLAYQGPPDSSGHRRALNEDMSPVEVSFVATSLLYQKIYNQDYQFTDDEKQKNATLDSKAVQDAHLQRTQSMLDILQGRGSVSTADLLTASDHFFSDLGIEPASNQNASLKTPEHKTVSSKGGL